MVNSCRLDDGRDLGSFILINWLLNFFSVFFEYGVYYG